eukprot:jgi/Psemu1/18148/gm1.18148_g
MKRAFLRLFVTAVDTHPVSMAIATVGTTTMAGATLLAATDRHGRGAQQQQQHHQQQQQQAQRRPLTPNEARFRAMIEHAQQSTMRERWETVAMAQEQLLRQGTKENEEKASEFVRTIRARSNELLRKDRENRRQRDTFENEQQERFGMTTMW